MSSNQNALKFRYFNPSAPIRWSWITLSGSDAADFLQRLTTVDIDRLAPGQGADGFFLSDKGRALAFFTLWRCGSDEFAFEFDAGESARWKESLFQVIDKYTFAESITLGDPAVEARWFFPSSDSELSRLLEPHQTVVIEKEIRICHHGSRTFGRPWLSAWGTCERLNQWTDRMIERNANGLEPVTHEDLERWRVGAMHPWVDRELEPGSVLPVEVHLQSGIAAAKGCYPGQEVIEKIFSYGSPPRRLVRISGTGSAPSAGSKLTNDAEPPVEIGRLTTVVPARAAGELSWTGLAIVRKAHAKEGSRAIGDGFECGIEAVAPYHSDSSE